MSISATNATRRSDASAGVTPTDDDRTPPPAPSRGHGPFERLTVNLTARSSQALEDAVQLTGDTKTDTINKALQLWSHVQRLINSGGAVYFREASNSDLERVHFF
jgi:hypothetical protein